MSANSKVLSATWAILLVQLVLACVAIIASVGIVCAQSQSRTADGTPTKASPSLLFVCALSFCLTCSAVLGMFGMAWHRPLLLCPVILSSAVVTAFHAIAVARWLRDWWRAGADLQLDVDWLIITVSSLSFQATFAVAIILEIRCYRHL